MIDDKKLQHLRSKVSILDIRIEQFKKGDYDFIVTGENEDGEIKSHEKQRKALEILADKKTNTLVYGGAAGGGKTRLGCYWMTFMCLIYPGTRWVVARNELGALVGTVFVTFKDIWRELGFTEWKFNAQKNNITFENGSFIDFVEVKYKPSDPLFEDLGSFEYTGAWLEEAAELHPDGASTIISRSGRWKMKEYKLMKKTLITCNPKRNWIYNEYYKPSLRNELRENEAFIQALITDNPFLPNEYVKGLKEVFRNNKVQRERLLHGNWEYEDNPYQLAEQEMIESVFSNDQSPGGKRYITADVARFGSDKARIGYWSGWRLKEVISLDISKTTDVELAIKTLRYKYRVPRTRCVVDQDGVGGGVVDGVGAIGFKNNGRAIRKGKNTPNYKNLQVQCLYELADRINAGNLFIEADLTSNEKQEIKDELTQIQSKGDPDPERKLDCKSKGDIKQDIGRSPDWRDMIMMRVFFDLKSNTLELTTNWH